MRSSIDETVQYATAVIEGITARYSDLADIQLVLVTAIALLNVTQAEDIQLDEKNKRIYKKLKEVCNILQEVHCT